MAATGQHNVQYGTITVDSLGSAQERPTDSASIVDVNDIALELGPGTAASAATLVLPVSNVVHVTGTTTITDISTTRTDGSTVKSGTELILIFDGATTVSDGTLKISGDFSPTADSTMKLVYDGTSWFELSRSLN